MAVIDARLLFYWVHVFGPWSIISKCLLCNVQYEYVEAEILSQVADDSIAYVDSNICKRRKRR